MIITTTVVRPNAFVLWFEDTLSIEFLADLNSIVSCRKIKSTTLTEDLLTKTRISEADETLLPAQQAAFTIKYPNFESDRQAYNTLHGILRHEVVTG